MISLEQGIKASWLQSTTLFVIGSATKQSFEKGVVASGLQKRSNAIMSVTLEGFSWWK